MKFDNVNTFLSEINIYCHGKQKVSELFQSFVMKN